MDSRSIYEYYKELDDPLEEIRKAKMRAFLYLIIRQALMDDKTIFKIVSEYHIKEIPCKSGVITGTFSSIQVVPYESAFTMERRDEPLYIEPDHWRKFVAETMSLLKDGLEIEL